MGNNNIVPVNIPSTEQLQKAREIGDGKGNTAQIHGYRKYSTMPMDPEGIMSPPGNQQVEKKLTELLSERFRDRGVIVFDDGDKIIARLDGKEYYVQLTIEKRILGANPIQVIETFYKAGIGKLQKEGKIIANTSGSVQNLQTEIAIQFA